MTRPYNKFYFSFFRWFSAKNKAILLNSIDSNQLSTPWKSDSSIFFDLFGSPNTLHSRQLRRLPRGTSDPTKSRPFI